MRRLALLLLLACVACIDDSQPQTIAITDAVGSAAGGVGVVTGEIRFPGTIGVDRRLTVSLLAQTYTSSRSALVDDGDRVRYRIEGVPDGVYIVGAALDLDGDELLTETDWAGFAGGSTRAPVLRRAGARQVTLLDGGEVQLDAEIGVVTSCLLPIDAVCTSDSDCRYVACDCPEDLASATPARAIYFLPTCPNATHTCRLPNASCSTACAPAPGPELASGPCLRDLDLTAASAD